MTSLQLQKALRVLRSLVAANDNDRYVMRTGEVTCPRCCAAPGTSCVGHGVPLASFHPERVREFLSIREWDYQARMADRVARD